MPPKQKSIFRRPEAQHFQLVHRSQRDPLIHDSEASLHILKPFVRENDIRKGKSLVEIESYVPNTDRERHNIGEAAEHGIFFDDTEYDYMQHLRDPSLQENGVETILIPASTSTSKSSNAKSGQFELKLPPDVLPPTKELDNSKALDAQRDIPDDIAGFNPDLNPHLRQVLEALDEDAFVDDNLDDDFFGELVEGGERKDGDEEFEFEDEEDDTNNFNEDEESWEAEFAKFKRQQQSKTSDDDEDSDSGSGKQDIDTRSQAESTDTLGNLPVVIGGKRRRRGAATASSGFSMTSSAVYRNAGLTLIDERFEQFDKSYDDDDIPSDPDDLIDSDDEAPDLIAARDDFEAAMDDFLNNYELVGGRMRPVLKGATGVDKLDTIRRALGQVRIADNKNENGDTADDGDDTIPMPTDIDEEKDRWDCETILSTYSNLENHPRLIRVRNSKPTPQIKLNPKTGLPVAVSHQGNPPLEDVEEEDNEDSDATEQPERVTITRPRNESKDEKKARKLAVKMERQARRQDKKANQEIFSKERKQVAKAITKRGDMKVKKL